MFGNFYKKVFKHIVSYVVVEGEVGKKNNVRIIRGGLGDKANQKRTRAYKEKKTVQKPALGFVFTSWMTPHGNINPFLSNVFFQYPLKLSEKLKIFS